MRSLLYILKSSICDPDLEWIMPCCCVILILSESCPVVVWSWSWVNHALLLCDPDLEWIMPWSWVNHALFLSESCPVVVWSWSCVNHVLLLCDPDLGWIMPCCCVILILSESCPPRVQSIPVSWNFATCFTAFVLYEDNFWFSFRKGWILFSQMSLNLIQGLHHVYLLDILEALKTISILIFQSRSSLFQEMLYF